MAWEIRGSNKYYYRKRRIGSRVVSEYVGRGPTAKLASQLDEAERERKKLRGLKERGQQDDDRAIDRQLDALTDVTRAVTTAVFLASGYHSHKRQWRRKCK